MTFPVEVLAGSSVRLAGPVGLDVELFDPVLSRVTVPPCMSPEEELFLSPVLNPKRFRAGVSELLLDREGSPRVSPGEGLSLNLSFCTWRCRAGGAELFLVRKGPSSVSPDGLYPIL